MIKVSLMVKGKLITVEHNKNVYTNLELEMIYNSLHKKDKGYYISKNFEDVASDASIESIHKVLNYRIFEQAIVNSLFIHNVIKAQNLEYPDIHSLAFILEEALSMIYENEV